MQQQASNRRRRGGRPSKCVPSVAKRILEAISQGYPLEAAAHAAGASYVFLVNWRNEDPDFDRQVHEAETANIARNLSLIQLAAQSDWRAGAWLLARRHPTMFGAEAVQLQFLQQINLNGNGRSAFVTEFARSRGEYEHLRQDPAWQESADGTLRLRGHEDEGAVLPPERLEHFAQLDAKLREQLAKFTQEQVHGEHPSEPVSGAALEAVDVIPYDARDATAASSEPTQGRGQPAACPEQMVSPEPTPPPAESAEIRQQRRDSLRERYGLARREVDTFQSREGEE
jgi:hypothetical protein